MLVDDVRRLFTWAVTSFASGNSAASDTAPTIGRSDFLKQVALTLAGVSILGFTWGVRNRYKYQVRKLKLTFANLPDKFRGLRIAQISDIHTGSFDNHHAVEQGIKQVLAQQPDIIFFTGDLVNNVSTEVDPQYKRIFSQLHAPMGVYSILGNHDYGDYVEWPSPDAKRANLDNLKAIHGEVGWKLMMNEHVVLEREGQKIAVIGIENWSSKAHFPRYGDLARAHAGLNDKDVPFKMLLSHDPSHWDEQVCTSFPDIDLTFSGHTHGMQFGIDSKIFKWSPVQYMYAKWAGIYQSGKQFLYVNRGFGFLGYPGRLGILPEITLIELA
jgi:predicted MPP superfamily phosphohydrolase